MLTRKHRAKKLSLPGTWKLQDAKARFSEVVRRAQTEGPQRVTVHDKDAVVVISSEEYARMRPPSGGTGTGADLIAVMQEGRRLGLKLRPTRFYPSVRPPVTFPDDEE